MVIVVALLLGTEEAQIRFLVEAPDNLRRRLDRNLVAGLLWEQMRNPWGFKSLVSDQKIYGPVVKSGITPRLHRGVRGSNPHVSTNFRK